MVFDRANGSTHAFDEFTSAVWSLPTSQHELEPATDTLASLFTDIPRNVLHTAVAESLVQLRELGMLCTHTG